MQGYDSVAIDADIEFGGTDQKFNLLFGRDVQAAYGRAAAVDPDDADPSGTDGKRKMSKSYGNYVAVNDPPEEMFGKLMSIPDDVMGEYWLLLLGEELDDAAARRTRPSASSRAGSPIASGATAPASWPRRGSTRSTSAASFPTTSRSRPSPSWASTVARCMCRPC